MSATQNAINLLDTLNKNADMINEVQSSIANDVFFKRCSVNLLIGKRGSGKTFNVLREILKLNWIKDYGGFSSFLYVSDKPTDPTFERVKKFIPLETVKCSYAEAVDYINQIADVAAKEKTKRHSIVLLDDCQDVLVKRTSKNQDLYRKLFENRQSRISYFLTLQDAVGINTAMKENCDSIWLFGGFSKAKFDYALKYISHETENEDLWRLYVNLNKSQAMCFSNDLDGTALTIITQ